MITENETLWKQYSEERKKLLDKLDDKEVWGWVDDKTSDEAIKDLPSHETLRNARQFLEDMMCSHYIEVPDMYFDSSAVHIVWNNDVNLNNRLEVQFYGDNKWLVLLEKNITESAGGEPPFEMEEDDGSKTPYFFLEDKFLKDIEKEQPWSNSYSPMLSRMKIIWPTDYWDGPLSGYCSSASGVHELHYFECVEELNYSPRTRMYAVYELSDQEQLDAWFGHGKWMAMWKNPKRKWRHLFSWRFFRYVNFLSVEQQVNRHQKKREHWRSKHKLLGYFTR